MPKSLLAIEDVVVQDWVTNSPITSGKLERDYLAIKEVVNRIIEFLRDMEKRFASGEPVDKVNGVLWYDASNALLKFYRSLTWEQILAEGTAGNTDIKAGGGAGVGIGVDVLIFQNATRVELINASGALIAATIPASTLNATGASLRMAAWGTRIPSSAATSAADIRTYSGLPNTSEFFGVHSLVAGCTDWFVNVHIVYTGASAQDCISYIIDNIDNGGSTSLANATSSTFPITSAATVRTNINRQGGDQTNTQEAEIIEF